jgi:FkbM family methyltransferase
MLDFARKLSPVSMLHYGAWRITKSDRPIRLALRSGARFELTHGDAIDNDYGVAYEVFVHEYYKDDGIPLPKDVRLVVDLGANVGLATLYFLHKYRSCRVIAYEPHPRYAAQAERNLELDGTSHRVEFHRKAAGASDRLMYLTDQGASSTLTEAASPATLTVEVEDIFPRLLGQQIDILKIDIEGGEYEILGDPRFEQLELGAVAMEWHSRGAALEDKQWCERRLQSLGFAIRDIFIGRDCGMFWAAPRQIPTNPTG